MLRAQAGIIAGGLVLLVAAGLVHARDAGPCGDSPAVQIWVSPETPMAGEPVRLVAVAEDAGLDGLTVRGPAGVVAATPVLRGGPPWSAVAMLDKPVAGRFQVQALRGGRVVACQTVTVAKRGSERPQRALGPKFWPTTRPWDRATENLYAVFVEALFDAPAGETLSFPSLAPALRDPRRNLLWGHLGLREDDPKTREVPPAEPDCADLPYYLRAHFAWKMGLPFGMRDCSRGTATAPPKCGPPFTNEESLAAVPAKSAPKTALGAFRLFLRKLGNTVHSGSGRTGLADDETDYYPVKLTREALRPGVIYADPYGHVLMIVKWIDETATSGGQLLAVDGQPDNSVARKRFWEGTFLFASGLASAGPGFKAFRPLASPAAGGAPVAIGGAQLERDRRFAPWSREQEQLAPDAFYARMGKLVNPRGLDASAAYQETLAALVEQLTTRTGSVDNGEAFMRQAKNPVVPMPVGAKIFETVGPWEDYATPSRDLRLIIAMNVLLSLPDRVVRHPELFVLSDQKPDTVRTELLALHQRLTRERGIEYRRSDGSVQKLTVADVLARKSGFEVAYNPNDCVELRWAAPEGSAELASCARHAPEEQRARMEQHRVWFREARRPSR